MRLVSLCLLSFSLLFIQCDTRKDQTLVSFDVFCEMVASDAKPIALGHPMSAEAMDAVWEDYEAIAEQYGVQLYREADFPITSLMMAARESLFSRLDSNLAIIP